jgi:hypothetical protein
VLQHVRFHALLGWVPGLSSLRAARAAPRQSRGARNTAWTGDYKGVPMLFATNGAPSACWP